ncbi:hypothetical protein WICMUC_000172, partial [Wickerhamomyces mucosus]
GPGRRETARLADHCRPENVCHSRREETYRGARGPGDGGRGQERGVPGEERCWLRAGCRDRCSFDGHSGQQAYA